MRLARDYYNGMTAQTVTSGKTSSVNQAQFRSIELKYTIYLSFTPFVADKQ